MTDKLSFAFRWWCGPRRGGDEAVDHRGGDGLVAEGLSPAAEGLVRGEGRLSPGRVAQTILVAIILMVANARAIEKFARTKIINAATRLRPKRREIAGVESIPADQLVWVDETPPDQG